MSFLVLHSSTVFQFKLMHVAEPISGWSHPTGHVKHDVLGNVSCDWKNPAGHFLHLVVSSSDPNLPFEHGMHDIDPLKLVVPLGHGAQLFRLSLPYVPSGHGSDPWQIPSVLQFVLCQPSDMTTDAAPPTEMVPSSGLSHWSWPVSFWSHPFGQCSQLTDSFDAANVPGAHGKHLTEPASDAYFPLLHAVCDAFPPSQ
jgi:hypothetical protein